MSRPILLPALAGTALVIAGCGHVAAPPPAPPPAPVVEVVAPAPAAVPGVAAAPSTPSAPEAAAPAADPGTILAATFRGHDRSVAKTTLASAPTEEFASLAALMATLPSDDAMRNHSPFITKEPDSLRVKEEQRNVRVQGWVYAAKLEKDMDFHVILGGVATGATDGEVMNTEITGLPADDQSPYFPALRSARNQFVHDILEDQIPEMAYRRFDKAGSEPIHVEIEGSLFYDVDHRPHTIGPMGLRPETAWEIHPISSLRRIP